MVSPPGFRLRWLAAWDAPKAPSGRRSAFESLVSDQLILQLTTQPQMPPQVDARLLATYAVDGLEVRVYASLYPSSLTLAWFRSGTTYTLSVFPVHLLDQSALEPQTFVRLISTIRYSGHRGPHGHPNLEKGPS
jgi:hypothetical protein